MILLLYIVYKKGAWSRPGAGVWVSLDVRLPSMNGSSRRPTHSVVLPSLSAGLAHRGARLSRCVRVAIGRGCEQKIFRPRSNSIGWFAMATGMGTSWS